MGTKIALIFGSIACETWEFLDPYRTQEVTVVCADGGILQAIAAGFTPDFYIGDNDSGGYLPQDIPAVQLPMEKDMTDLYAAYDWCKEQGYTKMVFTACTGGRQDHNLNNLYLLELAHQEGITALVVDDRNEIGMLPLGKSTHDCKRYPYFSILPLDSILEGLSIVGGKYPLDSATVTRTQGLTVSNEATSDSVIITLEKGSALFMKTR